MDDFSIKNISEETISLYKKCFDENESPKDKNIINWQFLKNPVNKQFVSILVDAKKDKVAAIYAVFPIKFKILDKSYIATQSLDTITDVEYRGQGLFIKLAKKVYDDAINDNVALVYGFPKGNSIHGFEKKN